MTTFKTEIGHNQRPLEEEIKRLKRKIGSLVADLNTAVDNLADTKFGSKEYTKPEVQKEVREWYFDWGITPPDLVQDPEEPGTVEGHYNEYVRELGFGEVYGD